MSVSADGNVSKHSSVHKLIAGIVEIQTNFVLEPDEGFRGQLSRQTPEDKIKHICLYIRLISLESERFKLREKNKVAQQYLPVTCTVTSPAGAQTDPV